MTKLVILYGRLFLGAVILLAGNASASSIYFADTDKIEFTNDSNLQTYLGLESVPSCRISIFTDRLNQYPWGEDAGKKTSAFPLSDKDWPAVRMPLINRIQAWKKLSLKQKIAALNSDIRSTAAACVIAAEKELQKQIQIDKACVNQGKSYRETKRGKLCLSDFEYAQLQVMEERNDKAEQEKANERMFYSQQQNQLIEEQRNIEKQRARREAWNQINNQIIQSRPKTCVTTGFVTNCF